MRYEIKISEKGSPLFQGVLIHLDTSESDARRIRDYFAACIPEGEVTLAEKHHKAWWKMLVGEF